MLLLSASKGYAYAHDGNEDNGKRKADPETDLGSC
jgi:hypothetical protein